MQGSGIFDVGIVSVGGKKSKKQKIMFFIENSILELYYYKLKLSYGRHSKIFGIGNN